MLRDRIFFVTNLLQDINILRPLVYLAARETDARIGFLVSDRFLGRDLQGIWRAEILALAAEVGASVHVYATAAEAFVLLQGGRGLLIAGSESDLGAHDVVHDLFRTAPPGYLRITLQHGLECVGFLQNREHVMAYGRNVGFAADVVCSWAYPPTLAAMIPSQRSKLYVTGPSTLLQVAVRGPDHPPVAGGMVCENLHSVRLRASGEHGRPFMDTFQSFCAVLAEAGETVTLRPHPGGQYVIRNNVALPPNVILNNLPIYRVDLAAYDYGISAPSTIVLDMVLAGMPVGVWRDPGGVMDTAAYDGLTPVSSLEDWVAFLREVRGDRTAILARQARFLERLAMPLDPAEIYRRFARLLVNATSYRDPAPLTTPAVAEAPLPVLSVARVPAFPPAVAEARRAAAGSVAGTGGTAPRIPRRVLFLANVILPTLQLSFHKPLAPLAAAGEMEILTLTIEDMQADLGKRASIAAQTAWFAARIDAFAPDIAVACRHYGPHGAFLTAHLRAMGVPLIYHIDDDLLNIPPEIGAEKYKAYSQPTRLENIRHFLENADLVYCSTPALRRRFRELGFRTPMVAGNVYCAASVMNPAALRPVTRVGYMGFDHAHDFEIVLPALIRRMEANPQLQFDLFGSIPMPPSLAVFGDRVRSIPPVRVYARFLEEFATLHWDIGICPLAHTAFNGVKANTKWVEYTAVGAAVIATRDSVYDDCGAGGCALLVESDGWDDALQRLIDDPAGRHAQVVRAQTKLAASYSEASLRRQVLDVFGQAAALHARTWAEAALRPRLQGGFAAGRTALLPAVAPAE